MANEYDKILKDNFREPKTVLLQQLIPGTITGIRSLVPKLQRTLEREADTVVEITTEAGKHFVVHIEWQSTNDPEMAYRMALYDLLLAHQFKQEVMGIVLYLGKAPLRMPETYAFFDFSYRCRMIDVRELEPETFLQSDDAGEIILAVLAGTGNAEQKRRIIRRIFNKLQKLYKDDKALLREKIKQLELLSQLRGETIQQFIIKEGQKMPVHIDIKKDLRYRQGVAEEKIEIAEKMLINGIAIPLVHNITGLPVEKLEAISLTLKSR